MKIDAEDLEELAVKFLDDAEKLIDDPHDHTREIKDLVFSACALIDKSRLLRNIVQ